jgi:hypothetical protein
VGGCGRAPPLFEFDLDHRAYPCRGPPRRLPVEARSAAPPRSPTGAPASARLRPEAFGLLLLSDVVPVRRRTGPLKWSAVGFTTRSRSSDRVVGPASGLTRSTCLFIVVVRDAFGSARGGHAFTRPEPPVDPLSGPSRGREARIGRGLRLTVRPELWLRLVLGDRYVSASGSGRVRPLCDFDLDHRVDLPRGPRDGHGVRTWSVARLGARPDRLTPTRPRSGQDRRLNPVGHGQSSLPSTRTTRFPRGIRRMVVGSGRTGSCPPRGSLRMPDRLSSLLRKSIPSPGPAGLGNSPTSTRTTGSISRGAHDTVANSGLLRSLRPTAHRGHLASSRFLSLSVARRACPFAHRQPSAGT